VKRRLKHTVNQAINEKVFENYFQNNAVHKLKIVVKNPLLGNLVLKTDFDFVFNV